MQRDQNCTPAQHNALHCKRTCGGMKSKRTKTADMVLHCTHDRTVHRCCVLRMVSSFSIRASHQDRCPSTSVSPSKGGGASGRNPIKNGELKIKLVPRLNIGVPINTGVLMFKPAIPIRTPGLIGTPSFGSRMPVLIRTPGLCMRTILVIGTRRLMRWIPFLIGPLV